MEQTETKETTFADKVRESVFKKESKDNVIIQLSFPRPVFTRFHKWAETNADNCYWLAIDKLLIADENKINFNNEISLLIDKDDILAMEIARVQAELDEFKGSLAEKKREFKTFGKKE